MAALATTHRSGFVLRVVLSLIVVFGLILEVGCTGDDDVEPSGRIVVFGSPDVLLIPPAGGEVERFPVGVGEFWAVAVSEDGSLVAFNPAPGVDAGGIRIMKLSDGSITPPVPNQPAQDDFASHDLAWAPDGKSLAFVNADRVFTIGIDGSGRRELGVGSFPTWTPDGEYVVFASGEYRGPDLDIAVIKVDGTGLRLLGKGLYPDVSPSGEEVAYSNSAGVFVRPLDGGDARLVVRNGFGPVWSPDGRFLAFTRHTECGDACSGRIFVVPADGGHPWAVGPTRMGDPGAPVAWIRELVPQESAKSGLQTGRKTV